MQNLVNSRNPRTPTPPQKKNIMHTVLCINGSDSMGHSGIQADIRTISHLGGYALTAVTSVTVQNSTGIEEIFSLPTDLVVGQVKAVYDELQPDVVKVGMVNNPSTILGIKNEIVGCRRIVCSPVILSSYGGLLMSNDSISSYCSHLLPICHLLILKCTDAEIILGHRICTDSDMERAAEELHGMGAQWVLMRGGTYREGRINALLSCKDDTSTTVTHKNNSVTQNSGSGAKKNGNGAKRFFSSVNVEGWQRHGVGGTLSTAIATQMAKGDDVLQAITNAHSYIHCQVVYSSSKPQSGQSNALYDRFMQLLSDHYTHAHDVAYYADALCISTRYLSQITNAISGRSPKHIIDDYLIGESIQLLHTTTLSIQQIALQLGFTSQIAFAKFFRTKKGTSPSSYRNRG